MTTPPSNLIPDAVREAFGITPNATATRIPSGLINLSWLVESPDKKIVLQRLHEIFPAQVNEKIDGVTQFLASREFKTTRLVATVNNELQFSFGGHNWRALSYVKGTTHQALRDTTQARSAARLLARFHELMGDYPRAASLPNASVHNVATHEEKLKKALVVHAGHRNFSEITEVASEILRLIKTLTPLPIFPTVVIHGDPKISNFLFDETDQAAYLIDLDTIGRGQLLHELGDAFRSWCNPRGEDISDTAFEVEFFEAALSEYHAHCGKRIDKSQLRYTPLATQTIYLELAARFCADALNESYFGWNADQFPTSSEHQLMRARGQLNAAKALAAQRKEINDVVERLALE